MVKKYKIVLSFMLTIVLGSTLFINRVNSSYDDRIEGYNFAIEFLNKYYSAIDQGDGIDVSEYINDTNLCSYMENKIYAKKYKLNVYGIDDMQNYSVSFDLINTEENSSDIIYTIYSKITFNYKVANFSSGYGEHIKVVVNRINGQLNIKDLYMKYDDYDTDIREVDLIKNYDYKIIDDNILLKQQKINENIISYYDALEKGNADCFYECEDEEEYQKELENTRSLHSLNRSSMVSWADSNCSSNNPSSGNSSITYYYDFSEISGNYDCTNFVSHSILAGGSVMYKTSNSGIDSNGWFFTSLNSRSSSWSGVANLFNFLKNNTVKGPKGQKIAYTDIYAPNTPYPYQAGDLLQFKNNSGTWRHSTLIVGYTSVGAGGTTLEAVVDGRTSDGVYNYRQRQSTIYSGNSRRVIVMKGYYN